MDRALAADFIGQEIRHGDLDSLLRRIKPGEHSCALILVIAAFDLDLPGISKADNKVVRAAILRVLTRDPTFSSILLDALLVMTDPTAPFRSRLQMTFDGMESTAKWYEGRSLDDLETRLKELEQLDEFDGDDGGAFFDFAARQSATQFPVDLKGVNRRNFTRYEQKWCSWWLRNRGKLIWDRRLSRLRIATNQELVLQKVEFIQLRKKLTVTLQNEANYGVDGLPILIRTKGVSASLERATGLTTPEKAWEMSTRSSGGDR